MRHSLTFVAAQPGCEGIRGSAGSASRRPACGRELTMDGSRVVTGLLCATLLAATAQSPFDLARIVGRVLQAIDGRYPNGHDLVRSSERRVGSNVEITWRIDRPRVTERETVYDEVTFLPGDRIRIRAGGCVQTGGRGDTWKSYVNPTRHDVARRYQGADWIPGGAGGELA